MKIDCTDKIVRLGHLSDGNKNSSSTFSDFDVFWYVTFIGFHNHRWCLQKMLQIFNPLLILL